MKVIVPWLLMRCTVCMRIGHSSKVCPNNKVKPVPKPVSKPVKVWKEKHKQLEGKHSVVATISFILRGKEVVVTVVQMVDNSLVSSSGVGRVSYFCNS